jgi:hypothetical protein
VTIIKSVLTLTELAPAPVFSFPFFRRYPFLFGLTIALTYSVFCILQEIILRSAVQHSLMHFLTGRFAKTRIIATTTLIAATHLHMKSLVFPLLIIIPNIFWCLLYDKTSFAALRKRVTYLDWRLGIVHPGQPVAMNTNASTQLATMLERDRLVTAFSSRLTLSS